MVASNKMKYMVTNRLITWVVGGKEVSAEEGEVRDDIPDAVVKHFLHIGVVTPVPGPSRASKAAGAAEGQSEGEGEVSGNATDTK